MRQLPILRKYPLGNITQKGRIEQIDALRGIAALLVLWLHVAESFVRIPGIRRHGTWMYDVISYVDLGRLGISLFFAISGFVICKSIRGESKRPIRNFAIRRFLRLFPAFWTSAILGGYVLWVLPERSMDVYTFLANLTMVPAVLGADLIIGLYWTLELELFFYILMALLFLFGVIRNIRVILFLAAICLFFFGLFVFFPDLAPSYAPWKTMPYHLAIMLWGVLFRYWYDQRDGKYTLLGKPVTLLGSLKVFTIVLSIIPMGAIGMSLIDGDMLYVNDGTAYLLTFLFFTLIVMRFPIRNRFMVWLGTISYSLYLFHPIVLVGLRQYLASRDGIWMSQPLIFYVILIALLTMALSAIVYHLIERPFIRLSYRYTKH